MKQSFIIFLAVALVSSGIIIGGKTEDNNLNIEEIGNYCIIKIDNASYMYREGYPIIPYYVKTYEFPAGTKIKGINVETKDVRKIHLNKKIAPSPPILPLGKEANAKEGDIYRKDTFYPEKWYDYNIGMGLVGGERKVIVSIHLYPIRYNAFRNEVLFTHFNINIDYELPTHPLFTADEYDLLIICPDEWKDEVEVLKQHKESYGIRTLIKTTGEIYTYHKGKDNAEKIKYAIKSAIEDYGIKYVLLVGDADKIPARLSYIPSGNYEVSFPSDLYYADIYFQDGSFCSWDSNDNGFFGEFKYNGRTDEVDLYPDVAIGRLACSNDKEVSNVINKIITYETTTYGSTWFRNILVCGGDTFIPKDGDDSGIYEGEYMNQRILSVMSDFNGIKLWASLGNLSASNIKKVINNGVGFIDFSGHGNVVSWATHPPLSDTWIGFTLWDTAQLSNGNKLPVVVIDACSCGRFDESTCFAWGFVQKSNGGGIASLGASGIAYGIPGYPAAGVLGWMELQFFVYYRQDDIIGNIWLKSLNGYINTFGKKHLEDVKTVEEWALFGDPTLKIGGYSSEHAVVYIDNPVEGYLYFANKPIMPTLFGRTIILGKINVEVTAYNVDKVEFYVDDELKHIDEDEPFEWLWDETVFGKHTIKVKGYGEGEAEDEISFFIFNI